MKEGGKRSWIILRGVSARSTFEPKGFVTPAEWKTEAFAQVVLALISSTHDIIVFIIFPTPSDVFVIGMSN